MPRAAGGHKIVARDIFPCQILANAVNSIVPCTCVSALSFINDNAMLLPFLSPFNFWIGNNFGFILTLQKANAKLKGMHSAHCPTKQAESGISSDKPQLCWPPWICMLWGIDNVKKGGKCSSLPAREKSGLMGRNYISAFSGLMVGRPFSPACILWSRNTLQLRSGVVQRNDCTRAMLITGYGWDTEERKEHSPFHIKNREQESEDGSTEQLLHCDITL